MNREMRSLISKYLRILLFKVGKQVQKEQETAVEAGVSPPGMRARPFFAHPFLYLAASVRLNGRPEADRYGTVGQGQVSDWPR